MINNTSIRQLNIHEGYGLLEKCNYQTQMHRHFPIEMIYCRDGFFDIGTKQNNHTNIKSVLIPSGLPHRFKCAGAKCELLFLDPLSQSGQFFIETYQLEVQPDVVLNLHAAVFDGNALEKYIAESPAKEMKESIHAFTIA